MFFRDGVRRIDFVLSYVDDKDGERKQVRNSFCVTACTLSLYCADLTDTKESSIFSV